MSIVSNKQLNELNAEYNSIIDKQVDSLLTGHKISQYEQNEIISEMTTTFSLYTKDIKRCCFYGRVYFKEMLNSRDDIKELIKVSVTSIMNKTDDRLKLEDKQKELNEYKVKYERELDLYRDDLLNDKTKLKEIKNTIDKIEADIVVENNLHSNKYDIDNVVNNLFSSIEQLVNEGLSVDNIDKIDALKLNSLFDSVICTEDNRLIFNISASRYLTNTFSNTNRNRCKEKYLCNSLYSMSQKQVMDRMNSTLVFISISE